MTPDQAASHSLLPNELATLIVESVPAGVMLFAKDGKLQHANAEACRILDISLEVLRTKEAQKFGLEVMREDRTPCPLEEYPVARALKFGESVRSKTLGLRRQDGTFFWALQSTRPVFDSATREITGAVITFVDITEQKERDDLLRVSEATLRSVVESAPDSIITADHERRITFINRTIPPYRREEVIGTSVYDYVHPNDIPHMRECIDGVFATGKMGMYEVRLTERDGGRIFHSQVGAIVDRKQIVGIVIASRELTEMRNLQLRLSIADRMASVGQLAAGVAHEVNNPLTYVMAALEQIRREASRESPRADSILSPLVAAQEGLSRIRSVVRDLSTVSRSGAGERVLLDVAPVLDSALRMAQVEFLCRAQVTRDYRPSPPVLANEARLGQVFLNLVINAAQAMAERDTDTHELRITTRTDDEGYCVVDVCDTGSGIPPELVDDIFQPFVTTKAPGVGTGLGLSICKDIMTSLGGSISVESTPGKGTCFCVRLPPADRNFKAP